MTAYQCCFLFVVHFWLLSVTCVCCICELQLMEICFVIEQNVDELSRMAPGPSLQTLTVIYPDN